MTDFYSAALDDESLADFRHEGPRVLHSSPRYDVCALMDALITAKLERDGDLPESERKEAA